MNKGGHQWENLIFLYLFKDKNAKLFYPYDIYKGKLYQIAEDEDEVWELHVTEIGL